MFEKKLTQNLHTLKTAAVSIVIQGFYKQALLSGNRMICIKTDIPND